MQLSTTKVIIIITLVGMLVLGKVIFNSFVGDDPGYIFHPYIQNFQLAKLFIGSSADLGGSSPITGQFYRPLMLTAFSFIFLLFGKTAAYYHLFQLVFHIINAILIFLLLKKFSSKLVPLVLSLLFLVHPINVETFAYVSNFQDTLFMFFGLSALLFLLKKKQTFINFLVILFLLFCSLLSKESGILFVTLVVSYLLIIKRCRNALYYFSIFGLTIIYLLVRLGIANVGFTNSALSPIGHLSFIERVQMMPEIVSYYLLTFILPINLAIGQVWIGTNNVYPIIPPATVFILSVAITTFAVLLFKTDRKSFSEYIFFMVWFVLGIALHLQIVPLEMTVADRWFYFPFVGLLGMIAVVLKKTITRRNEYLLYSVAIIIILIFAIRSFIRLGDWKDAITLYSHDTKVTKSYLLEHSLGFELMEKERMDEALVHLQKSVAIYQTPFNSNSMGVYFYKLKDHKRAVLWFEKSISSGDYYLSFSNLSNLHLETKDYRKAAIVLEQATDKFPDSSVFYHKLSIAEYKNGNMKKALDAAISAYNISKSSENEYIFRQLIDGKDINIKD